MGQFVKEVRRFGFQNVIYAIEPASVAFQSLEILEQLDYQVHAFRAICSDHIGTETLNIYSRSDLNSLFLPHEGDPFEIGEKLGEETVPCLTLDSFIESEVKERDVFLKIDVQGSEMKVLGGLKSSLTRIRAIQVEVGINPIYRRPNSILDVLNWLSQNNFQLVSIVTERFDETLATAFDVDLLALAT